MPPGPVDSFDIVIQFGAILAVLVHYRALLSARFTSLLRGESEGRSLFLHLAVAFVPTAVAGILFRKLIKRVLFGPIPILAALVVGEQLVVQRGRFFKFSVGKILVGEVRVAIAGFGIS